MTEWFGGVVGFLFLIGPIDPIGPIGLFMKSRTPLSSEYLQSFVIANAKAGCLVIFYNVFPT